MTVQEPRFRHVGAGPPVGENSLHRLPLHVLPITPPGGDPEGCRKTSSASLDATSSSESGDCLTMPIDVCPSLGSPDRRYGAVDMKDLQRWNSDRPGSSDEDESESSRQGASSLCRPAAEAPPTTEVTAGEEGNARSPKYFLEPRVADLKYDAPDVQLHETAAAAAETETAQSSSETCSFTEDGNLAMASSPDASETERQRLPLRHTSDVVDGADENDDDQTASGQVEMGRKGKASEADTGDHETEADGDENLETDQGSIKNVDVGLEGEEDAEDADEGETDAESFDEEDELKRPARKVHDIDQGWAWVVLVAAFLGMTIFGTFTFSTGIFQAEILQVVEPDVQKTSWVGASHLCVLCVIGPFAGLVKNRLGSRATVFISSVIICVGMIGASLSHNVTQLILTYGVITGIGTGMALNPMFVSVSYYFERYRGFACGMIASGAGTGMFLGGPIIRHLIETYGLSGAFLIWGGVGLNIGVVAMVMTPSSVERRREQGQQLVYNQMWRVDSAMLASVSTLPSASGYWGSVLGASSFFIRDMDADPLALQQSQILLELPERHDAVHSSNELSVASPGAIETAARTAWLPRNFRSSQSSVMAHSCHELVIPAQAVLDGSARITLHAGNFRSSQVSVGESGESVSVGGRQQSPRVTGGKASGGRRRESPLPARGLRSHWKACSASLDAFRILRNPGFLLYISSASLWVFGESIVFTYLPTYAESLGTSPFLSATLITAVGFTSTLSRLVVGFVAGDSSVGPDLMHIGMLGLCGVSTITFPLYSSHFTGQVAYAAIYGLYSGGLASVINLLIISFIGMEHIAIAFGVICFGQGVASLLGPTIAGAIASGGDNYGYVFVFSGSLLLVATVAGFPMVLFKPPVPEVDTDVEKTGETTRSVRVRMKGENCHT